MESFETEMHKSDAQGAERLSNDFKDLYRHQACMPHWGIHMCTLRDLEPPHGVVHAMAAHLYICRDSIAFIVPA